VHREAWIGVAAGLFGTTAGIIAAAQGSPVGGVAAVACLICSGALVAADERVDVDAVHARLVEVTATQVVPDVAPPQLAGWDATTGPETVTDPESGLLDHRVFSVTFERKVAAARRHLRPLSIVLLDIADGLPDGLDRSAALSDFGSIVTRTLRDSDVPCRVGETTFGLILEDTPEPGGVWVAERLQIAASAGGTVFSGPLRAAVATYPNHGLKAEEVLRNATAALARAASRPMSDGDRFATVEVPAPEM
jgi:diguanylate cyclase (GGDEF)-like protein